MSLLARYDLTPRLSVQFNADNLLNRRYYSQIGFYSQLAYGPPRSAAVTVRYAFQ